MMMWSNAHLELRDDALTHEDPSDALHPWTALMNRRLCFVALCALLAGGCSLVTSLDGYTFDDDGGEGGMDGGGPPDAGWDASSRPRRMCGGWMQRVWGDG